MGALLDSVRFCSFCKWYDIDRIVKPVFFCSMRKK